jgi:hypothetical protein
MNAADRPNPTPATTDPRCAYRRSIAAGMGLGVVPKQHQQLTLANRSIFTD